MTRLRSFQTNFSRGQVSARLGARVDLDTYRNAAGEITNGIPTPQGGTAVRPATWRRAELAAGARLEEFNFSLTLAWGLAFSPGRLDIFDTTGAVIQTIAGCPWDATSMWTFTLDQEGNFAFIADNSFRTVYLQRTGAATFSLVEFDFSERADGAKKHQPYYNYVGGGVTIEIAAGTNEEGSLVTLAASNDVFDLSHVGERFSIRNGEVEITAVATDVSATASVKRVVGQLLDPFPLYVINGSTTVTVTAVDHGLSAGDTFELYNVSDCGGITAANLGGARTVLRVTDDDRFEFTAGAAGSSTEDGGGSTVELRTGAATTNWKEPVFSALRGWPQAVMLHDGRLWFGGPPNLRDGRWASKPLGDWFNFDMGDGAANDGITAIGGLRGGSIRHMLGADDVLIFCDKGEAYMPASKEPITQATVQSIPQTTKGAAFTRPQVIDGATVFLDALGLHLHEFVYSDSETPYSTTPLTTLDPDVLDQPMHSCVFPGDPENAIPFALYPGADGSAGLFFSQKQDGVGGFIRWETLGSFISFGTINGQLFACVERDMDGATEYWLEEFDWTREARVDSAVKLTGAAATEWSAPDFANETIYATNADGYPIGPADVDVLGDFTVTYETDTVILGFGFNWAIETLPPVFQIREGLTVGAVVSLVRAVVKFHGMTAAVVAGQDLLVRDADDMEAPYPAPFTGEQEFWLLGDGERAPTVRVEGAAPSVGSVLGMMVEVDV